MSYYNYYGMVIHTKVRRRRATFKGKRAYNPPVEIPPVEIPQKLGLWSSIYNAMKALWKAR